MPYIEAFKKTANSMLWTYSNLKIFVVHDQAVNFILDCDFMHYSQLEKCINFVRETYDHMKGTDYFGLSSLGDQAFTMDLEVKQHNPHLKIRILDYLQESIEDILMQEREVQIKAAIKESINRFEEVVPVRCTRHGGRDF